MKESSLNPKLREICDLVGLFERNTMYSFRRTALVESRRTSGTEFAREVANHTVDGDSIWAYDHDSLEDFDMTNFRLKNDSSVSRESLRQRFSQAETRRVTANENELPLTHQMAEYSTLHGQQDPSYVAMEVELTNTLIDVSDALQDQSCKHMQGYVEKLVSQLKFRQAEPEMGRLLSTVQEILQKRKELRRRLRMRYNKEFRALKLEHLNRSQLSTDAILFETYGRKSSNLRLGNKEAVGHINESMKETVGDVEMTTRVEADTEASSDDDEIDVNQGAVDESVDPDMLRVQPAEWEDLPDEVVLAADPESPTTRKQQLTFFKEFLNLVRAPCSCSLEFC
jgi:hypothetical protein